MNIGHEPDLKFMEKNSEKKLVWPFQKYSSYLLNDPPCTTHTHTHTYIYILID